VKNQSRKLPRPSQLTDLPTPIYVALIVAIGIVGLALRVVDLETVPPGLHFDQAANGLLSLEILSGRHPIFFPSYAGREALFMYVIAGLSALLGPGILALRLAGALCGAATVVGLAFLGTAQFDRRVGVAASAMLAGLYWHLHVSRLGERTIMVPLLDVLALLALWQSFRRRSLLLIILGGGLVGLQLYTYPSSRFFVVALVLIGLSELGLMGIRRLTTSSGFSRPTSGDALTLTLSQKERESRAGSTRRAGRFLPKAEADWTPARPDARSNSSSLWERVRVRASFGHASDAGERDQSAEATLSPALLLGYALAALAAAMLVALPLVLYVLRDPSAFLNRPDEVAVWSARGADWVPALADSVRRTVGMFFVAGDHDWKYNLAGQSVFDPLSAGFFLLGIAGAIWQWRESASRVALIWLICMLVPGFITIDAPQFMRTLGAAPAAALLAARGLAAGIDWLSRRSITWRRLATVLWGWPLIAGGLATYRYFGVWAPSPAAYLALEGDVTEAAQVIRAQSPAYAVTNVASRYGADPTISYLDGNLSDRLRWFDGRAALPLPPPGSDTTLYVLPRTATDDYWYKALPAASRVAQVMAPDTGPAVEAFVLDPATTLSTGAARTGDFPSADFAGVARLVDADVPTLLQAGQPSSPAFFWRLEQPPSEPLKFFVHLIDSSGQGWTQYDEEVYPTSEWRPGQTLIVRYPLNIPSTVPLGTYAIEAGLERANGAALTATNAAGQASGTIWRSPPITMVRAVQPPDVASLRIGRPMDVTFGSAIRLVGASAPAGPVQDGDSITLTLYWQVAAAAPAALNTVIQEVDSGGKVVGQAIRPPTDGVWPSRDWKAGDVVVDRQRLVIPAGLPSGSLTLTVGLRDGPEHALLPAVQPAAQVPIGTVSVQARSRPTMAVTIGHPQPVTFANSIRLLGFDLDPTTARPGETLHLRLYWQTDQTVDRSWTVFTHLLDDHDQIHAQQDGVPGSAQRPTTTWAPGETIVDAHDLVVQPGTPPGAERLEIGLYDAATGERLKTAAGEDRVLLGQTVNMGQ
jgi:4-amino-4-deoxy-L-arabinose transferase-like glycosyltransferase